MSTGNFATMKYVVPAPATAAMRKTATDFGNVGFRLLKGRKVAALVQRVPVNDVAEALSASAGCFGIFFGEDGCAHRHIDRVQVGV